MKLKYLIILCFLLACTGTKERIPEEFLSKKEFASILKEVHLAEANFELQKTNGKEDAQNELMYSYQTIYSNHHIDENKFQETLNYYANHPDELEEVYAKVLEELTKERASLDQQ